MTDKFLWNNKAITTLSGAHNNTTTTINLNPGDGALFPSPSAGEHFAVTIQATDGTAEVCYCTSRSADALTVTRGQEASLGAPVAQTYVGGEAVELRVTAGTLNEFSQTTVAETISGNKTHTGKVVIIDGVADQEPPSILQSKLLGVMSATGAGTVDAITATFSPVFAALTNGLTCFVRASGANTITAPTFKPDSLVAKTIVRYGNTALVVGDISAAGHELILRYNSTNDNWELLNPASVPDDAIKSAMLESTGGSEAVTSDVIRAAAVDQTAIGALAVGQGELKTTTGTVSTSTVENLTLPGGSYGFYPQVRGSLSSSDGNFQIFLSSAAGALTTSYVTRISINATNDGPVYAQQRYIQASPPYDLGNGTIPLFIFALIDNITGAVLAVYVAEDPPWANNGPTNILPDRTDTKTGKKYQRVKQLIADYGNYQNAKVEFYGPGKIKGLYDRMINDEYVDREVTQAIKQADMQLIPHPFTGNDMTDKTVVLLDPLGKMTSSLQPIIHQGGSSEICEALHGGYIKIGTTDNGAKAPPGVMPVDCSFKV